MKSEKTIIIARHGALDNPRNIVYNRDSVMKPKDIIHLSSQGQEQMRLLASLIQEKDLKADRVFSSPAVRAQESAKILQKQLGLDEIMVIEDLDDAYAPGPYKEGMTMDELQKISGNIYTEYWLEKYSHETPEQVAQRMLAVFYEIVDELPLAATALLVSHGDAIAWLVNSFDPDQNPTPENLRDCHYPKKGEVVIIAVKEDGQVEIKEFLTQPDSDKY